MTSATSTPAATARSAAPPAPPVPSAPSPRPSLFAELREVVLLYAASALMLAWIFPAGGVWPLAFVALVPWALATVRVSRAWLAHWLSFLIGWAFFLVALRWLMPVTGLGYAALAGYLAVYWTLAAWGIRTARRHRLSVIWSLPIVWVGCEYLRGTVMTGFPWLFLGHALYAQLPLIQISDLVGAYGVSFLVAMVNGFLVEMLLLRHTPRCGSELARQRWIGGVATAGLAAFTLTYGYTRLAQVDFGGDASTLGPRIAVVQEDFPLRSTPPYGDHQFVVLARYLALAAEAAAEKPDLIAFPETVWAAVQNIDFVSRERATVESLSASTWWWGQICHRAVSAFARGDYEEVNAVLEFLEKQPSLEGRTLPRLPAEGGPSVNVLVGSVSIELFPEATYPKFRRYNSALFYERTGEQRRQRYDKRHLVPFGEYVPFRQARFAGLDLHYWLYRPLNKLSPFSDGGRVEYSLSPGDHYTTFPLEAASGAYHFGVPICYESTTPYIVRELAWDGGRRRADFLVNISNDGWFRHQHELPQHLAINVFRAIENRVGIARSVNTGISGFIDPDGRIYSRVVDEEGVAFRYGKGGVIGYDLEPVYIDRRTSLYARTGDVFAVGCVLVTAVLWLSGIFERWILAIRSRIVALFAKSEVRSSK